MREKQLASFGRVLDIMDRLRLECPWDREQTFLSLRNNTIEECYELVEAILGGDMEEIKGELGDLLLHIVFYSKLGDEVGGFDISSVCDSLCEKLIYRHPHVFGEVKVDGSGEVSRNWESLKLDEKGGKSGGAKGLFSGVPRGLPSMTKAFRLSQKAASVGFDWSSREEVWKKVEEKLEVEEQFALCNFDGIEEEFGDLFFALVNAARLNGVDPELALERTNEKFVRRFAHIESGASAMGVGLSDLSFAQMERLYQEAKVEESKS